MLLDCNLTLMEIDNDWNNGAINWHIEVLYLARTYALKYYIKATHA